MSFSQGGALKRLLLLIGIPLLLLWIAFVAYIDNAMHRPPEQFGQVMKSMPMPAYFLFPFETMWSRARSGSLAPGSQAPDFEVETLDKSQHMQLASLWSDKPVVLVFGSYT
ncbi:MAG: hypothetical protein JOZ43_05805 [Acidobacteriales bacterium]|nr:hypothetical protein [Terriglobales bacterium]